MTKTNERIQQTPPDKSVPASERLRELVLRAAEVVPRKNRCSSGMLQRELELEPEQAEDVIGLLVHLGAVAGSAGTEFFRLLLDDDGWDRLRSQLRSGQPLRVDSTVSGSEAIDAEPPSPPFRRIRRASTDAAPAKSAPHPVSPEASTAPAATTPERVVLPIAMLARDPDVQAREQLDPQTVDAYAEDMREGVVFPPPDVFTDGDHYFVADGFHRVAAAEATGATNLAVNLYRGGKRDAILHAVGSNCTHGLRRTNADKKKAVLMVLADPLWAERSDTWVAEQCRVSAATVKKYRPATSPDGDSENCEVKPKHRLCRTRGGGQRLMNVAGIGSARTAKAMGSASTGDEAQAEGTTPTPAEPSTSSYQCSGSEDEVPAAPTPEAADDEAWQELLKWDEDFWDDDEEDAEELCELLTNLEEIVGELSGFPWGDPGPMSLGREWLLDLAAKLRDVADQCERAVREREETGAKTQDPNRKDS